MDPSIIVAFIALIGVLAGIAKDIWKDKNSNDKLTITALKELSVTDLLIVRHLILDMERTRSTQGYKTHEDELLWNDLVTRYHWGLKEAGKENGVIEQAEYRWARLPVK